MSSSAAGSSATGQASSHPSTVYKILSAEQWASWEASGTFSGAGIDVQDGYIHLSTSDQVVATYDKFFRGKLDDAGSEVSLVLATVDLDKVADPVKWEVSRGGALFPHVYGQIHRDAVVGVLEGWKGEEPAKV